MKRLVKFRRKELGYTLDDIAQKFYFSKQYVWQVESERRKSDKFTSKYYNLINLDGENLNLEEKIIYKFYNCPKDRNNFYNEVVNLSNYSLDDYKVYLVCRFFTETNLKTRKKYYEFINSNRDLFSHDLLEIFYLYTLNLCVKKNKFNEFKEVMDQFDFSHKNMLVSLEVTLLVKNNRYVDAMILISNYLKNYDDLDYAISAHLALVNARVMVILGELTRANCFLIQGLNYGYELDEMYLLLTSNSYLLGKLKDARKYASMTSLNDKYILLTLIDIEERLDFMEDYSRINTSTKRGEVFKNLITTLFVDKNTVLYKNHIEELKDLFKEDKLSDLMHYVYKFETLRKKNSTSSFYIKTSLR